MMAYRLSPEHPRPAGCKEGWLARWTVAVCRRLHTTRMLRLTTVFLPAYWCGVAAWLVRQTTLQGLYHSLTDTSVAFAIAYDTVFFMRHREELLGHVREAIQLATEIEDLMAPSELSDAEMSKEITKTTRLVQFIFGVGSLHVFIMLVLFAVPTILVGESPSPLVHRNTLPLYVQYPMYLYQDFNVFFGDSCFTLIEYVHLGSTLASSLMYRMLAARFSTEPLSASQLRHLVTLHHRLINNTRALQVQLSVTSLLVMTCAIMGLVMSTLSIMSSTSELYMYLVLPSCAVYIAIKCSIAEELLRWSTALGNALVVVRYVGHLDLPTASSIFKRWYSFVQYLSNY